MYMTTIELGFTVLLIFRTVNSLHLTLTDTRRNTRLLGKTLLTITETNGANLIAKCLQSCMTTRERRCKAINLNKKKGVCELLSASIEQNSKIENNSKWEYYGPKSKEPEYGGCAKYKTAYGEEFCCPRGKQGDKCQFPRIWEQQNPTTIPVCYKNKDDQHGNITIKRSGTILAFKLQHISGELKCNADCSSYWGMHRWAPEEAISTLITDRNKNIVAPKTDYTTADYRTFTIPGYSHKSPELVMEVPGTLGYEVTEGDVFWIWYAEDFFDGNESNNSGEHCINVYVKFSPW